MHDEFPEPGGSRLRRWLKRPWPPGIGFSWPCGCCATPCCDTTNVCANSVFTDNFSSSKSGYTNSICSGGTGQNWVVSTGFLFENFGFNFVGGSGRHTQAITVPSLSGLCISVSANIYVITGKTAGITGVHIGTIANLYGSYGSPTPAPKPYGAQSLAGATDCFGGTTHTFGTANTNFTGGDCLCLVVQDTGGGGGTYNIKSYVNGSLLDTFSGVALTLTAGSTVRVGVVDTNGGQWDNLCIATS